MSPEEKIQKYGRIVKALAERYATDALPAEDLEQEAYLVVLECDEDVSPTEMSGKIRNRLFPMFRTQALTERLFVSLDATIGADEDGNPMTGHDKIGVPSSQENAHRLAAVASEVTRMTDETQEILRLRADGVSWAWIATRLGREEGAVKMIYYRARKLLAEAES